MKAQIFPIENRILAGRESKDFLSPSKRVLSESIVVGLRVKAKGFLSLSKRVFGKIVVVGLG